jgi:hypothetical protein
MADDSYEEGVRVETEQSMMEVDITSISSAALARLIEEVRNDDPAIGHAYDRVHNRHNR